MGRSVDPREAWALLQRGEVRLLDLRTGVERRRYGAPPGAIPVSLARHVLKPEGERALSTSASMRCDRSWRFAPARPRWPAASSPGSARNSRSKSRIESTRRAGLPGVSRVD